MTVEENLKMLCGELVIQVAKLMTENQTQKEEIARLKVSVESGSQG